MTPPAERRAFLRWLVALGAGVPTAAALEACSGRGSSPMGEDMPGWMMSDGTSGGLMRDMGVIRELLTNHDQIRHSVQEISGGVRTVTTSADRRIADLIRTHVRQMQGRVQSGEAIRWQDPLFREIFKHSMELRMQIENSTHGVRVTETSQDPQVVLLIRQHARAAVSEFVRSGMERAMRPTPLPAGYRRE